jgi:hypothetical protein
MFPDFLCIGAQKAGTSWLYRNLKAHPDIWLPPIKEIHYFDIQVTTPFILQLRGPDQKLFPWARILYWQIVEACLSADFRALAWNLPFFLRSRNDAWYESLFTPQPGQIAGEVTPAYAVLDKEMVTHIHELMPRAKIIFLLRNPIKRCWSQLGMRFRKRGYKDLHTVSDDTIKAAIVSGNDLRSDYLRTLDIWESVYPKDQMIIGFFDDLVQNPRTFLRTIYDKLEVRSSDEFIPDAASKKSNAGNSREIPETIARYLAEQNYDLIARLHERFDNVHTASWFEYAQRHI